jgi:hypothetical protein
MADLCPFDVTPLATAKVINNTPVYNLNYTSQDYSSMKTRLLELIHANFNDEFNDFTESSLAMMLIECWAWLADLLSFKIDQIANELFIDTVTEPENAFRISKLVGFKPQPPLPSRAMFIASKNSPHSLDVSMKTPVVVQLETGVSEIRYELFAADVNNNPIFGQDIVIPAGSTFNKSVIGLEGSSHSANYKSTGKANQTYTLPYPSVFYNSIQVRSDDLVWEQVENFTEAKVRPEYIVEYDADYRAKITFGNGKAGLIPPQNSEIKILFRIANRNTTEIITGAFENKVHVSVPGIPHGITVDFKNFTKSDYGYPGDSINEIRKKLPSFLRTQDRAVTGADYKYLANRFMSAHNGSIGKATAALRNHGCAGNIIDIIVLAQTGNWKLVKANDNLKSELLEDLNGKKIFTDYLCIKDGEIILTDIHVDIVLDKINKKNEEAVKRKIVEILDWFFDLPNWEFGQSLKESDIVKTLARVSEVRSFEIAFVTAKNVNTGSTENVLTPNYNEIIRPDNIIINFVYKSAGEL